jgi:hypothetical protein
MLGARAPQRGRAAWLPHEKRQSRRMAGPHAKACGAQTGSVAADQKGGSPATAGPHSKAPGATQPDQRRMAAIREIRGRDLH